MNTNSKSLMFMNNQFFVNKILPFERSYWVIPNRFMAGNLPYQHNHLQGIENLENLVALGVRCFINLMEENEKDIDGREFIDYSILLKEIENRIGEKIHFFRFPIKDMQIPLVPQMHKILDTIEDFISKNKTVYLHCWGGKGRTGTVVGCFLLENQMATQENVIDMIAYLRRTDPKADFASPETQEQKKFVKNWAFKKM